MRMRRMALGMSQEKLAKALGLTFQQVQKYERGANRMGSSRLQQAADVLGVAAAFFFEGAGGEPYGSAPSPAYIDDFVASEEGLRLAKSFMHLRPAVRRRIVDLVNEVAGESGLVARRYDLRASPKVKSAVKKAGPSRKRVGRRITRVTGEQTLSSKPTAGPSVDAAGLPGSARIGLVSRRP